jgi:tetratricopeptide (TPR) repeat protein
VEGAAPAGRLTGAGCPREALGGAFADREGSGVEGSEAADGFAMIAGGPGDGSPDAVLDQVQALIDVDRPADARRLLGPALTRWSGDARLWMADATAARLLGQLGDARRSAEHGVAIGPSWSPVIAELALILASGGLHDLAAGHARRAVELAPRDPWSLTVLAIVARSGGRIAESLAAAEQLVGLRPDSADAWEVAATSADAAGDRLEAERCLRRALAIEPERASALRRLADVVASRPKGHPEAIDLYARALVADPDDPRSAREARRLVSTWRTRWLFPTFLVAAGAFFALATPLALVLGEPTGGWIGLGFGAAASVGVLVLVDRVQLSRLDPAALAAFRALGRGDGRRTRRADVRRALAVFGIFALGFALILFGAIPTGSSRWPAAASALAGLVLLAVPLALHRYRPLYPDLREERLNHLKQVWPVPAAVIGALGIFLGSMVVLDSGPDPAGQLVGLLACVVGAAAVATAAREGVRRQVAGRRRRAAGVEGS